MVRFSPNQRKNKTSQRSKKIFNKYKKIAVTVIGRSSKLSNFIEWNQYKIIYKRYASLYFITLCDKEDNELIVLEMIHHFVE